MSLLPSYWEAQAVRPELRRRRTGGTCSAVLQAALSRGLVSEAFVVGARNEFPWAESLIARTAADVASGAGSKYTLVGHSFPPPPHPDYAAVTLPCQSPRARASGASLVVGLFCGLNISPAGYRRLLGAYGTNAEDVLRCDFRAPQGGFVAELRNGAALHIPRYFWLAYFYPYPMCVTCRDYLNHGADIAIGDRHKEWNSVVAWTAAGENALRTAESEEAIRVRSLSCEEFEDSLMTPFYQKEVLGGYGRHWPVRHRAWVRRLPFPLLSRLGNRLYERTVDEYRASRRPTADRGGTPKAD